MEVERNSMVAPMEMKWVGFGFKPPLFTYKLNWARRTSGGYWDEWDTTALQIQDLSVTEATHNIDSLQVSGEKIFCFFGTWRPEWGLSPRTPTFQAGTTVSVPLPARMDSWDYYVDIHEVQKKYTAGRGP